MISISKMYFQLKGCSIAGINVVSSSKKSIVFGVFFCNFTNFFLLPIKLLSIKTIIIDNFFFYKYQITITTVIIVDIVGTNQQREETNSRLLNVYSWMLITASVYEYYTSIQNLLCVFFSFPFQLIFVFVFAFLLWAISTHTVGM